MMTALFNYIKFRINQFFRLLNHNSDFGVVILIGLFAIIFLNINQFSFLFLLPITLIHFRRKDIKFLKQIFPHFWKILIFIEYSLLYSLFILSNKHYPIDTKSIYTYLGLLLLIALPPYRQSEFSILKWNFIPNTLFEWRSFIRDKEFLFFIYFIGLLLSAYHPFTLFLMAVFYLDFISNAFKINENKELLQAYFKKYRLKDKLKHNLLFFNITILPTSIIYITINYLSVKYWIYYFIFMNFYLLLIVSRKYSVYHHKTRDNNYNSGLFMKYLLGSIFIFPFFIFFRENYNNSVKKINQLKCSH